MASKTYDRIRKLPSGKWQVRYTDPKTGQRVSGGTFRNKSDAEKRDREIQTLLDNGIDPKLDAGNKREQAKIQAITFRDLAEELRETKLNRYGRPLSYATQRGYISYVNLAEFADKPIKQITSQDIAKFYASETKRAPNQASKAYSWFKTVFKYAIKRKLITDQPCDIEGAGNYTPAKQTEVPTLEQVRIMYESAQGDLLAILALSAGGGLRKGEILELRKENIQVEKKDGESVVFIDIKQALTWVNGVPTSSPTKTPGSVRRIPLHKADGEIILDYVKSIPAINKDALLFVTDRALNTPYAQHRIDRNWRKLREIAGYGGHFHSLRAFSATEFGKTGATTIEIMERYGHRNIKTAMRYQRSTGREVELLARLAR
jgi:integrase